jgi:hypothetical protein
VWGEQDEEPKRCRNCGKVLSEDPGYEDQGLCGDCYWDDQTDADGAVGGDTDGDTS